MAYVYVVEDFAFLIIVVVMKIVAVTVLAAIIIVLKSFAVNNFLSKNKTIIFIYWKKIYFLKFY